MVSSQNSKMKIIGFSEVNTKNRIGTCKNDTAGDDGKESPETVWKLSDQSVTWIIFHFASNSIGEASLSVLDCVSIISSGEDNNANPVAPAIAVDNMFDSTWQQFYISHSEFNSVGGINYITNTSATGKNTAPVMLQYTAITNPQGPLFDCTLFVCDVNLYNVSVTNSSWPLFSGVAQNFDRMIRLRLMFFPNASLKLTVFI
jgi:hypothetical protein